MFEDLIFYTILFFIACWVLSLVPDRTSGALKTVATWKWPIVAGVGYLFLGEIGALIVGFLWVRRSLSNVMIAIADRKENQTAYQAVAELEHIQVPGEELFERAKAGTVAVIKGAGQEVAGEATG